MPKRDRVPAKQDAKALEVDGCDGRTTTGKYFNAAEMYT